MSGLVNLSTLDGPVWTSSIQAYMDCLIYCSDGILVSSQVQLAAASVWLRELLADIQESEENRIKTIVLPFVSSKLMKQVLDLISGGSLVLHDDEIPHLVEVSSLLGCTGDMLKEPVISEEAIVGDNIGEDAAMSTEFHVLVHQLQSDRSIDTVLHQMQLLQEDRANRMEERQRDKENIETTKKKRDDIKREIKKDPLQVDSDEFIVSDQEFSDYEGTAGSGYRKKKSAKFDMQTFEDKLMELGESTAARGGAAVECGSCDRFVSVPQMRSVMARINHFKNNHFNKCRKKGEGGEVEEAENESEEDGDEDVDHLMKVYRMHLAIKTEKSEKIQSGRRKAELPPIETIQSFLKALGNAKIVNNGNKIKCGLCCNKLKVIKDRPLMGNIRYFERTHLVRCPVKLKNSGKPTQLISENFLPGRSSNTRVLKSINLYDTARAQIVNQLISRLDTTVVIGSKRKLGRPRKDKENEEEDDEDKDYSKTGNRMNTSSMAYMSKRKQCLAAATICFKCKAVFESGPEIEEHFSNEHPKMENPFYCLACQDSFKTYDELVSHLEAEHNHKETYSCPLCDKDGFETQTKLNKHMSDKHPDEDLVYYCSMCSKGFSSFQALRSHQKTHEGGDQGTRTLDPKQTREAITEAFTCRFCNECIMYGKELDTHIRENHSSKTEAEAPYLCTLCPTAPKSFNIFYYYQLHLREHGLFIDCICRFCKITNLNRNKFNEHFKMLHPDEMPYECPWPFCDRVFRKKQVHQEHITLHRVKDGDLTDDIVKTCEECSKVFYTKNKLETHIKTHHDGKGLHKPEWDKPRRFACTQCSKSFSNRGLLEGHIRKHENNPCFMCDFCGKAFYRKDRLDVHTRAVHLGEKKYECGVCLKRFLDNYKLRRHMKTHISGRGQGAAAHQLVPGETEGVPGQEAAVKAASIAAEEGVTAAALAAGDITTVETTDGQAVAIVQVPSSVSYELGANNTYLRKIVDDGQEETIQTILHINPPVIAKKSSYIKFENAPENAEDQNPVDFTQQGTEPRFIISTQYIPTS